MNSDYLEKARQLILSLTQQSDAQHEIDRLKSLKPEKLNSRLEEFYDTAPHLAENGDTKGISIILRVFDFFNNRSHDRMLLHYIAQAEANKALNTPHENQNEMKEALELISKAFEDANGINAQIGTS